MRTARRSAAVTSTAASHWAPSTAGDISSLTTSASASGRSALNIGPGGEASAAGLIEHTAALGGGAQLGNVSAFGRDQSGSLHHQSQPRRGAAVVRRADAPVRAADRSMIRLRASRYGETVRLRASARQAGYGFALRQTGRLCAAAWPVDAVRCRSVYFCAMNSWTCTTAASRKRVKRPDRPAVCTCA